MILYHLTRIRVIHKIFKEGLLPFRCYEWQSLLPNENNPVIWFTDSIREKGSYLHSSRCLVQVDSVTLNANKLKETKHKGWWVYEDAISISNVQLVDWRLYRNQKPKFWDSVQGIIGGGFKHTFGNSQAALNLMNNILCQQGYEQYKRKVCRLLSKQLVVFNSLMTISNGNVRETTLKMYHTRFKGLTENLPEVIKTHIRCVETGIFRQLLKGTTGVMR